MEYLIRKNPDNTYQVKTPLIGSPFYSIWLVDVLTGEVAKFPTLAAAFEEIERYELALEKSPSASETKKEEVSNLAQLRPSGTFGT